jgi:hypothetical protein
MPISAPVIWSIDLLGGLLGRQAFLAHHALDVLDHHDGVVHQQADGQHHAEHGQRVDREAEGRQHAEGAEQHHRHGDGRDQRGAEVLQEQVHHQEDQHHRLDQRLHHFLDRDLDEGRGVVGTTYSTPAGK